MADDYSTNPWDDNYAPKQRNSTVDDERAGFTQNDYVKNNYQQQIYNNHNNQNNWNQQQQPNQNWNQQQPQQQYQQQPQQQYQHQQQQQQQNYNNNYNNNNMQQPNDFNNNWNPPPNQQQYNNNNNNNNNANNNWQQGPPPNQNNHHQTQQNWHRDPTTKVTQNGDRTITETTESGGGSSKQWDFGGPSQLGPGRLAQSDTYQPQSRQEKIDYFRLKLWEMGCLCNCGATIDHPCLNLWTWAIFWLVIFMFNSLINAILSLANIGSGGVGSAYAVIMLLFLILSICVNVYAMYGLFHLVTRAFLIQLVFFVLFLVFVLVGVAVYGFSAGFILVTIVVITCCVWAIFVFWKVYKWAKYFDNGGVYDPMMFKPT